MALEITITRGRNDPAAAEVDLVTDFAPNILDDYDMPAYHFRLYMMGEEAIRSGNFGPESRAQRVVIAESGATTIEIDNVMIRSIAGISKEAGVGASTNFSMQLRQPFGATLIDEIFAAANYLGIKNFQKVPMFLELSFRARDTERTSTQKPLSDDKLSNVVWVWPIFLNKMAINVNAGGSVYELEATIYGDLAYTNQAADLEKAVSVKAATVIEFFQGLEQQLNDKEEQKRATDQRVFDKYEFYIDKEIAQSKIVPEIAEEVANRAADYGEEVAEKNEFVFQPGTSIDRIVENILSSTSYFQKAAKGTEDSQALGEEGRGERAAVQTLYRLITDTRLGEFDPGRNDYSRIYRYLIVPYEMTTLQTKSNSAAGLTSQQRFDLVRNKGRLRKAYNYIYTGLNDQVLDFDLTFNFNWYAALPFQAGVTTNASRSEPAAAVPLADTQSEIDMREQEGVTAEADNVATNDKFNFRRFVGNASRFVGTVLQGGNAFEGINNGLEDQFTGNTSEFIAADHARGSRIAKNSRKVDKAQQNLREVDPTIEDISEGEVEVNPLASNISYLQSMPGLDQNISGEYSSNAGKTLISTMFEQAKSPVSADLLNIELKIKGDPYWLEPAPVGRNEAFQSSFDRTLARYSTQATTTGGAVEVDGSAEGDFISNDTTTNQTYILFRSFTPMGYDDQTGLTPKFTDNNVLNGVYAVRVVTSEFSAGQFTQSLQAIRDPQISLQGVDIGLGVADTRPTLFDALGSDTLIDAPIFRQERIDATTFPGGANVDDRGLA